jgi:hypothetical protein
MVWPLFSSGFVKCILLTEEYKHWVDNVGLGAGGMPPETLRPHVDKVVEAITELHNREHDIAFKVLGYSDGASIDKRSSHSFGNLDHLEIPLWLQLVGLQFQPHLD